MSVTQADRDAADKWQRGWVGAAGGTGALAEAFDAHRLAERARIVAWLQLAYGDYTWLPQMIHAIERGEHDR